METEFKYESYRARYWWLGCGLGPRVERLRVLAAAWEVTNLHAAHPRLLKDNNGRSFGFNNFRTPHLPAVSRKEGTQDHGAIVALWMAPSP